MHLRNQNKPASQKLAAPVNFEISCDNLIACAFVQPTEHQINET